MKLAKRNISTITIVVCFIVLGATILLLGVFWQTTHSNLNDIPQGKYIPCDDKGKSLGWGSDYFLSVGNKKAAYYSSGLLSQKYRIVVENGITYFDEYEFSNFPAKGKSGSNRRIEVHYDEETAVLNVAGFYYVKED